MFHLDLNLNSKLQSPFHSIYIGEIAWFLLLAFLNISFIPKLPHFSPSNSSRVKKKRRKMVKVFFYLSCPVWSSILACITCHSLCLGKCLNVSVCVRHKTVSGFNHEWLNAHPRLPYWAATDVEDAFDTWPVISTNQSTSCIAVHPKILIVPLCLGESQ